MTNFLRTILGVPDFNIIRLLDYEATLTGITKALISLAEDARIEQGDAIVIFYAGHGAEALPPVDMDSNGKRMQLLAPYDFDIKQTSVTPDTEDGERCGDTTFNVVKNGLLDIQLSGLLKDIADAKGDNIVSALVQFMLAFF